MNIYSIKGASGPVANVSHTLSERTLIGSADDCDVRAEVDGMVAHHAQILVDTEGLVILSRLAPDNEVLVNGASVTELALASGDEIRIANCRWVLQAPGLRPEKKLTQDAVRKRAKIWPWWLLATLTAAAALAWYLGYFPV
jgi:hypothetical protein